MSQSPAFPTFQDRDLELALVCAGPNADLRILNFYGEAGIGKSRLLQEAKDRLLAQPRARVLDLDLANLDGPDNRPVAALQRLVAQLGLSEAPIDDPASAAGLIADRLSTLGQEERITLLVDTTEAAQDDSVFWRWLEKNLLSPLVSDGNVLVVLAGRLPAPVRLVEVRRYLKVLPLAPLPLQDQARSLVEEVFLEEGSRQPETRSKADQDRELTDIVLDFSHGHPFLSIQIATFLADPANRDPIETLRYRVAAEVVGPFIAKELFPFEQDLLRWRPLMEWASILHWFDATVLYRFDVAMSGLSQPETEWQDAFVKAIARLRAPYAVVAWQEKGYSLVGTVKSIVASYMQAAQHQEYLKALKAAAQVFDSIADGYFEDNPQAGDPYRQAAKDYRMRLQREDQHGEAE